MPDPFEEFGNPPPSVAEPQDGGQMPLGEKKCAPTNACERCAESGSENDERFEASSDERSRVEQQDTLLMDWLLAMTPEQRLRSHDGALEWFSAVRTGRIKLYGAMDITAPAKNFPFGENVSTGI